MRFDMDITNQSKCKSPARDMSKIVFLFCSVSVSLKSENAVSMYNVIRKNDSRIHRLCDSTVCG